MTEILIEVRPGLAEGDLAPRPAAPEKLLNRIGEIADGLKEISNRLAARLDDLDDAKKESAWKLGEVEVKFSLDLEAEAGVVVARAKTTAGFEATLKWTRE